MLKLHPQSRNNVLGILDICAAENVFLKAQSTKKIKVDDIKSSLLANTTKYLTQIHVTAKQLPTPDRAWIHYDLSETTNPPASSAQSPTEPTDTIIAPRVIKFDEETGEQLNEQEDAQIGGKITRTEEPEIELPMREWFERRLPIGAQTADKATAVAVLHCIHETMSPPSAIKIVAKQHDDVITKVRATRDIAAKSICNYTAMRTQAIKSRQCECVFTPPRGAIGAKHFNSERCSVNSGGSHCCCNAQA